MIQHLVVNLEQINNEPEDELAALKLGLAHLLKDL